MSSSQEEAAKAQAEEIMERRCALCEFWQQQLNDWGECIWPSLTRRSAFGHAISGYAGESCAAFISAKDEEKQPAIGGTPFWMVVIE